MFTLFQSKYFSVDILYRPKVISLGIDLGVNKIRSGKISNCFIDISVLFWTLGFEVEW